MTQNKSVKIIAKYNGTVAYNDSGNNKFNYHLFTPTNKINDLKWVKVHEKNPIIPNLVLKEGNDYELNWIEKNRIKKRVFNKSDNIVVVSQEQEKNQDNYINNCQECQKELDKAKQKVINNSELELNENIGCLHGKNSPSSNNWEEASSCPNCDKMIKYFVNPQLSWIKYKKHVCSKKDDNNQDELPDSDEEQNQPTPDVGVVRKYCRDNEINRLEYDEKTGKLLIIYKTNKPVEEKEDLTEELERIKEYVKKKGRTKDPGKRYITDEDWGDKHYKPRQENPLKQQKKTDWTPWIIAGGIGLFIIILIAVIGLVRKGAD